MRSVIIAGLAVAVLLLGGAAAWLLTRADVPGVDPAVTTESAAPLPSGPLGPDDVADLRFDQAVRGYRMAQVDAALTRLTEELAVRDREISRLRGEATGDHDAELTGGHRG